VAQVAQTLDELARGGGAKSVEGQQRAPSGVDSWVRPFVVKWVKSPLPTLPSRALRGVKKWQVMASPGHPLADPLQRLFAETDGEGVVLCLPGEQSEDHLKLLLRGAEAMLAKKQSQHFVLVQHGWGAGGFARTLHLECPKITSCVVDVPFDSPAANWVQQEALPRMAKQRGSYDVSGTRHEPRLQLLPWPDRAANYRSVPTMFCWSQAAGKASPPNALGLARKIGTRLSCWAVPSHRLMREPPPTWNVSLRLVLAGGITPWT
jgi:enediyne polyketide synthase